MVRGAKKEGKGKAVGKRRQTAKHIAAFWTWYELDRNYEQTKSKLRVAGNTLASWIKAFDWHERADSLDSRALAKAENQAIAARVKRQAEMSAVHFKMGRELLEVSQRYLAEKGIDNGAQAVAAARAGVEIQRKAEGLPDWLIEIGEMTDDELKRERDRLLSELATSSDEVAGDQREV